MKIIKNTLCAAILFTASISAQAATFSMSFSPSNTSVGLGVAFTVDVFGSYTADVNGADQLLGGAIDVLFDESILQINSVTINAPTDIASNVGTLDNSSGNGGAYDLGFASFSGIDQGDGAVSYATLEFETVGSGTSTLELQNANNLAFDWTNSDLNTVDLSFVNGFVTVFAPVPLPAASWFFASGLIGLFQISRKKARA